jgi:hypothetical protein
VELADTVLAVLALDPRCSRVHYIARQVIEIVRRRRGVSSSQDLGSRGWRPSQVIDPAIAASSSTPNSPTLSASNVMMLSAEHTGDADVATHHQHALAEIGVDRGEKDIAPKPELRGGRVRHEGPDLAGLRRRAATCEPRHVGSLAIRAYPLHRLHRE